MATNNPDMQTGAVAAEGPRLRDAVILFVSIGLLFTFFLGSRPLSVPDEGRYVEIPREMTVTGDWLTPRLNGIKYFEKPPLFYWFEAFLIKVFGLSEWSARTGPMFFALVGCLAVYYSGARLFGRRAGILSAIVLSTSLLYFALSRLITLDMPVSVLLTAALLSFLLGTREPAGISRRLYFWGFYAFAALAVLTKGLIGIVFPGMIIFMWMLVTGEWRLFSSMHLVSGTAVFLLIAAPWHLLVQRANPEFFDFYFVREHFQRYLTKVHHHYKPFWFFVPIALLGLFPWSVFLVQAVKQNLPASWKDRHQHKDALFLMLWAGLIFLFFSASSSKLIPYILPILPPLTILIGKYLADAWERPIPGGVRIGEILFSFFCVLFAIAMIVLPRYRPEAGSTELTVLRYILVLVFLVGGGIALTGRRGPMVSNAVIPITITVILFYTAAGAIVPPLDNRSLKPLALAIKPLLRTGDEIVHYHNYYQDLPVYLERRMTIVEWKGELDFGTTIEDTSSWMISEAELWKRWQGPTRIFLVATQKELAEFRNIPGRVVFPVAQKINTVILSNIEVK